MQKHYPNTVTVKKNILVLGVVVVIAIVSLIGYEFMHFAMPPTTTTSTDSRVSRVANTADADWANPESLPAPKPQNVSHDLQPTAVTMQPPQVTMPTSSSDQTQEHQALQKAMSAPITINQITALPDHHAHVLLGSPSAQAANSSEGDDPNLQRAKQAFLQEAATMSDADYLASTLKNPLSPYELQAGTIIPGILMTGINSDLPGQLTGQVRTNVYDSISGEFVLIPQGAKLTGVYDSRIVYGQQRVLIVWQRILFPNGQSINLHGMPGVDLSGYAGFHDEVNNHYSKIFGSVVLMSVLSAGAQLSQPQNNNTPYAAPTVGQMLAQSLGTNLSDTGNAITQKNLNVQPTLAIRPGYCFNISVTKDIVFNGAYHD